MSTTPTRPSRGDIWYAELDPIRGNEQGGTRPCLIISGDDFNRTRTRLVFLIPLTSQDKGVPFHVPVEPTEGGLRLRSFVKCEDLRSVATERLRRFVGRISPETLAMVETRLRLILQLP